MLRVVLFLWFFCGIIVPFVVAFIVFRILIKPIVNYVYKDSVRSLRCFYQRLFLWFTYPPSESPLPPAENSPYLFFHALFTIR